MSSAFHWIPVLRAERKAKGGTSGYAKLKRLHRQRMSICTRMTNSLAFLKRNVKRPWVLLRKIEIPTLLKDSGAERMLTIIQSLNGSVFVRWKRKGAKRRDALSLCRG